MKQRHHEIKLDINFCDEVLAGGCKNFEVRYNNRGYQKGDTISFIPVDGTVEMYHKIKYEKYEITYVLSGWGIKENFVVFGIRNITKKEGNTE